MAATHSVNYQLATPADEADLRALLLDNAMPGWVSMALTREPNYFAGSRLFGTEQTIIAREQMSRQPVGVRASSRTVVRRRTSALSHCSMSAVWMRGPCSP